MTLSLSEKEPPVYVQKHFELDPQRVAELIATVGAGDLITNGERGLQATRLPFSYDPNQGEFGTLRAHLSLINQQWKDDGEALVIISGPEHYISPSIIPSAAERDTVVPTWNYVVAHVRGRLVVHHDDEFKLACLRELVAMHETSWSLDNVPDAHLMGMLKALVGVEIEVTSIEAKAKLSQNASSSDLAGMISALAASGHGADTAAFMESVSVPHALAREARVREAAKRVTD